MDNLHVCFLVYADGWDEAWAVVPNHPDGVYESVRKSIELIVVRVASTTGKSFDLNQSDDGEGYDPLSRSVHYARPVRSSRRKIEHVWPAPRGGWKLYETRAGARAEKRRLCKEHKIEQVTRRDYYDAGEDWEVSPSWLHR